jgi:uncharacterized beta-barrel protein YwiB (DUF1934 family)
MISFRSERSGLSMDGLPVFFEGSEPLPPQNDDLLDDMDEENEIEAHLRDLLSKKEDTPEISEMLVEGRLVTTSRRVELVYEELLDAQFGSTVTKIGFDRNYPSMISMLRSGAIDTAMVFENRHRHICIYNAPAASFEVCINTYKVDNRLLTDGVLVLDYYMEIRGVQTDHCKLTLTVKESV